MKKKTKFYDQFINEMKFNYSKASKGLLVPLMVIRICTDNSISLGPSCRK